MISIRLKLLSACSACSECFQAHDQHPINDIKRMLSDSERVLKIQNHEYETRQIMYSQFLRSYTRTRLDCVKNMATNISCLGPLKVHKIENFCGFDFEIFTFS